MTLRNRAEADDDARKGFALGIAILRERHIRRHAITRGECVSDQERQWWDEGETDKPATRMAWEAE